MPSILDPIPNNPFYSSPTYQLSTPQGLVVVGNGVSIDQFGYLNVTSALGGTVTSVVPGVGLIGAPITVSGTIDLAPATNVSLGGIKVGANLIVAPDGTLSALAPGSGTISGVIAGTGLTGGGSSGVVTLGLGVASTTQIGGVLVSATGGLSVTSGTLSLATASTTQIGGVTFASVAETIIGSLNNKAVTPVGLASKVASLSARGLVQLSDSTNLTSSSLAATPTAVKTVATAANSALTLATAALPKTGGTMTGVISFAPGQTFPGVALPKATTSSLGVIQVGTGLSVNSSGVLSTVNSGTVTGVTAGPGLGAPASGNTISTTGTLRLLPPSGTSLGGVKEGTNISIGADGTISTEGLLQTNNPYSFNGYIWPIPNVAPALPCPGTNGQVLTISNNITGELAWTNTGTLSTVTAGTGISVVSTATNATVSLANVPSVTPGEYGATALIPTFQVNQYGQVTSSGQANPYAPFQTATVTIPTNLVLDFTDNNTNWKWTLTGNIAIQNPSNTQSGQRGSLILTQDSTPFVVTWDSAWKGAGLYSGPAASQSDLIDFVVVAGNQVVITNIVSNIG